MSAPQHADFTALAEEHRDSVYRQMLRLCGNREDAEDVLTDALLAAYRKLDTLEQRAAFGAWLAQIARRLCFHLRSQQRIYAALSLDELSAGGYELAAAHPGPEELAITAQLRDSIRHAVEALPPELRDVYILRDLEEQSGEEAAAALGITVAAMKTRLHRARTQLRSTLDALLLPPASGKDPHHAA